MSALGVGRTAFNTSRRALVGAGLVREDKEKGPNNRKYTLLSITLRGEQVANKVWAIQSVMSRIPGPAAREYLR